MSDRQPQYHRDTASARFAEGVSSDKGSVDVRLERSDRAPTGARELVATVAEHDGVEALSEQARARIADTSGTVLHVAAFAGTAGTDGTATVAPGRLLAYGNEENGDIEFAVSPDARRQGIGGRLLDELRAGSAEAATVWSHGDLPGARALAASRGLERHRELLQLRRPSSLGALSVAAGGPTLVTLAQLDAAWGSDAVNAELLRVNNAAFSWHPEQGGWDDQGFPRLRSTSWFCPEEVIVALPGATGDTHPQSLDDAERRILGFHWTKRHEDGPDVGLGEVFIVAVDPEAHGKGVGGALTRRGVATLVTGDGDRPGVPAVLLYVESDNTPALATYRRLGFDTTHVDVAYR